MPLETRFPRRPSEIALKPGYRPEKRVKPNGSLTTDCGGQCGVNLPLDLLASSHMALICCVKLTTRFAFVHYEIYELKETP